jgi:hypothetical protein
MIAGKSASPRGRTWLAVAVLVAAAACTKVREPITVDEGEIVLHNLTDVEWRDVRIVVNHHFSGGVASLAPGARVNAPLSRFQTAFGQHFDRGRQSVFKIDVTAREEPGGKPVTLTWGDDQRK